MRDIAVEVDTVIDDDVLVLLLVFAVPADRPIRELIRIPCGHTMFVGRVGMIG